MQVPVRKTIGTITMSTKRSKSFAKNSEFSKTTEPESLSENRKTSKIQQLYESYAQRSTVHGVSQTVGRIRYFGQRYIWYSLIILMAGVLTTVIYLQLSDFHRYPTVIDFKEIPVTMDDFPSVTFCDPPPLSPFSFIDTSDLLGQKDEGNFKIFNVLESGPFAAHMCFHSAHSTDAEVGRCMLDHSIKSTRIKFVKCGWNKLVTDDVCWKYITNVITTEGSCFTFHAKINGTNQVESKAGFTPSFNVMIKLKIADRSILIGQREGIQINLHEPEEFPFPDAKHAYFLPANSSCVVKYKKVTMTSLSPPYKDMLSSQCFEAKEMAPIPLSRYANYTKQACERECLINYTATHCGCRYYLDRGREPLCSFLQTRDCLEKYAGEFFDSSNHTCHCPSRCRRAHYETSISCAPLTGAGEASVIHITFLQSGELKTDINQVAVYALETILANIGGQIGLFLGFSLVSVVEIVETLFLAISVICCSGKVCKRNTNRGKDEESGKLEMGSTSTVFDSIALHT